MSLFSQAGYVLVQQTVSSWHCTSVPPQGVPTFHAAMSSAESVKFSTLERRAGVPGRGWGAAKDGQKCAQS